MSQSSFVEHCKLPKPIPLCHHITVMIRYATAIHFNTLNSSWQVSPLVPGPIPTINWPRGVISGFCMAFLDALNPPGFTDSYDFFYLPMDTKNRTSLGQDWLQRFCMFFSSCFLFFLRTGVLCLVHFRLEMKNRSHAEAPTWVMPSSTS